ncbi:hypothetical protein Plhal304r1_c001g0000411 [Plasmopara halstedii]
MSNKTEDLLSKIMHGQATSSPLISAFALVSSAGIEMLSMVFNTPFNLPAGTVAVVLTPQLALLTDRPHEMGSGKNFAAFVRAERSLSSNLIPG